MGSTGHRFAYPLHRAHSCTLTNGLADESFGHFPVIQTRAFGFWKDGILGEQPRHDLRPVPRFKDVIAGHQLLDIAGEGNEVGRWLSSLPSVALQTKWCVSDGKGSDPIAHLRSGPV